MTRGTWILPTKGRPDEVARFFEQWRRTCANTPGVVLINGDEDPSLYDQVNLPSNWRVVPVTASCVADAVNTFWLTVSDHDWVGLLCDDLHPETMECDRLLIEKSKPDNIVASANGSQENRLHGALVYGGELLRRVGWVYPPGIKHSFHDDAWELIGKECQNVVKVPSVMVRHVHGGTVDETGRKRNSYWNEDEKAYRTWRLKDAHKTIRTVIDLMREQGSLSDPESLSAVSLMISAPNHSGAYEGVFMISLQRTIDMLRALDVKFEFTDCPHIAEPGFARALMHGSFLRSPHTHLLMIDDDMGWLAKDVIRLLSANMPLVAAAGPRKLDYPAFAAHITQEDSRAMLIDERSGAMRVTEVGGAFLMIRRDCAEKMAAAYSDLAFDTEHGAVEHDLFQNLIVMREGKRTRLSEDYAYCHRARQIGIGCMVVPDIRLQHVGKKTWEGALLDILKDRPAEAAE